MTMDNAEILIDYRAAANKKKQIEILAELNECSKTQIARIIAAAGEPLPEPYRTKVSIDGPKLAMGGDRRSADYGKDRKDPTPGDDPNAIPERDAEPKDGKPENALVTRKDLVELLARVLPEGPARRDRFTADEIKAASFDIVAEQMFSNDEENNLAGTVIALAAFRQLIERLTGEAFDGEEEG